MIFYIKIGILFDITSNSTNVNLILQIRHTMVGILGVNRSQGPPEQMIDRMCFEDWYGVERFDHGQSGIGLVHHADRDPAGWSVVETGQAVLYVYGYFTDRGSFTTDIDLLEAVIDTPEPTLAKLDGSFALVATDGDRLVVATDKLASRTVYVAPDHATFASSLGALTSVIDDPSVDTRAISEMLQTGFTWGRKTLLDQVDSLTYGEYALIEGGEMSIESYWSFDSQVDQQEYVASVYDSFQQAVTESTEMIPNDSRLGVYLSGGLDSRLLAALATDVRDDIISLTYDTNPGGGVNLQPARDLAEALDIDNELLEYTPKATARHIREGVRRTDGMQSWHELHALPGQLEELADYADVVFWAGGQGELFGEDIPSDVCMGDVITSFTEYWSSDVADRVLVDAPPIRETFETEFDAIERGDSYTKATELMIRNYYPRAHARANVTETVAGVRIAQSDGDVVDATTPVPKRYRWGPLPIFLNKFGHVLSPLKLELVRRHRGEITQIPYERTGFAPNQSIWLHDTSDLAGMLRNALGGESGGTMFDEWYRQSESLQSTVDNILTDAMTRPFFDADALAALREEHLAGNANNIDPIAKITTVEAWLQEYVD